jgi:hypothetical protein
LIKLLKCFSFYPPSLIEDLAMTMPQSNQDKLDRLSLAITRYRASLDESETLSIDFMHSAQIPPD